MENKQHYIALVESDGASRNPDTFEEGSGDKAPSSVASQEHGASGVDLGDSNAAKQASCFPGSATVEMENGVVVGMDQLRVGDRVRVSKTEFSDVYMFSHRDADASDEYYLRIEAGQASVTMTAGHFVYVHRRGVDRDVVPALGVKVGDKVQVSNGSWRSVSSISRVSSRGLYNPHTLHGDIFVDGVLVSTFTLTVSSRILALLAPLRAVYNAGAVGDLKNQIGLFLSTEGTAYPLQGTTVLSICRVKRCVSLHFGRVYFRSLKTRKLSTHRIKLTV